MDLQADYTPAPGVEYTFQVPLTKAPDNAPPVGAGRGPGDQWYQEVRIECTLVGGRRHVTRISGSSRTSFSYTNEGMEITRQTPRTGTIETDIGDPKLSCSDIWGIALSKGAPRDAVANIDYSKRGYDFGITGSTRFELDKDGKPLP